MPTDCADVNATAALTTGRVPIYFNSATFFGSGYYSVLYGYTSDPSAVARNSRMRPIFLLSSKIRHVLACCYSCCVRTAVYANYLANYLLIRK